MSNKDSVVEVRSYTRKKAEKKKSAKKVADSSGILHEPRAKPQKRLPITEGVQVISRNQDGKTTRTGHKTTTTQKGVEIFGRD